ncbi:expressed unknown protein [Seminavis robusta]|uniref:PDZ domain-containing protein n=1 Tax=Seminavis robusta TaxID=568900 RepID=A0A9N8DS05_9STRA|nr:expressed unknown protein [Seminavis robusta]|eukprot:Sro327_g118420.1 n/a (611) ;mRNA; r:50941-52773
MYKLSLTTATSPRNSSTDFDIPAEISQEVEEQDALEQDQEAEEEQEEEHEQEEFFGDTYTENEIPFQVTVNSALGDECSTLADEGAEFEFLWAQLELQQRMQQQQQQQQMMMMTPMQTPHQLFHMPMPMQFQPMAFPQQQQQPLVRQVSQEYNNNNNAAIEEPYKAAEASESEDPVDVDELQDQFEVAEREADRERRLQAELETWSVHDQLLRESQEESQMESYLVPDHFHHYNNSQQAQQQQEIISIMTPDTNVMNEFSERTPHTPTLYDRGEMPFPPSPGDAYRYDYEHYEGDNNTVPTELVPPPLPTRGPSRSTSAARPPPPNLRAPSQGTLEPPPTRRRLQTRVAPVNGVEGSSSDDFSSSSAFLADATTDYHHNQRAKCITATIIKTSKRTNVGLELHNTPDGAICIARIAQDGLVHVSGAPLQVGDILVGISTSKTNHTCGNAPGSLRKNDIVRLLKKTAGRITLIAQNPHGNPSCVESMTVKPHPEFGTGIFFLSGGNADSTEEKTLQIHSVPANGLFAHSMLARGDQVISINGVDCAQLDACVATDIVKSAPRYVSIVTKTSRNRSSSSSNSDNNITTDDPALHLRTVPEERRASFGLFRRR